MQIEKIGRYTIIKAKDFKQIYSPNNRMLQVMNDKVWYSDTHLMKIIKVFKRILKEINNGN